MRNQGISLLEAVFALLLIGITLATIIPVFANYAQQNRRNEVRTTGVLVAQQYMDSLRTIAPDNFDTELGGSPVTYTITENGLDLVVTIEYAGCGSVPGFNCTITGAKYVRVGVTYNSNLVYEVENVFTKLQ